MAQVTKVTDYFVSRKRNNEAHSLKRQKLADPKELFAQTTEDLRLQPLDEKQVKRCDDGKPTKKPTRSARQRQTTRARKTKSVLPSASQGTDKQLLLTDSIKSSAVSQKHSTEELDASKLPTQTTFDFKLAADLPSDLLVTDFDSRTTPSSTPTKRSSPKSKSVQTKRKRTAVISDGVQKSTDDAQASQSSQCRKRLDMPAVNSSDSSKNSTETVESADSATFEQTSPLVSGSKAAEKVVKEIVKEPTEKVVASSSKDAHANPADLKAKLSKCGKLADLKACLQRVKTLKTEISSSKKSAQTASDSKSVVATSSSVPAYEKYKDLAVKIPASLTLPYKYKLLEDMFKGTDTIVSIMYNRLERCTFDKLKKAVQEMLRKNFEPKHLGQIKTVYPESYELRQEKGLVEGGLKSNKYQMTVQPLLQVADKQNVSRRKDGQPVFGSGEVVRRKETFRRRLFDIVKTHHQRFIEGLKPPVKVDPDKVTRWHPKFLLDNVPEIESAPLPQPPEVQRELITAKDVLNTACGKLPSRVERALQAVAEASEKANNLKNIKKAEETKKLNVEKTTPAQTITATKTSGISSSLLERIRAKEALKAQAAMLRDETTEQEMDIIGRLPEMIKILRSYFITEKKAALTEDSVIIKLCDSYRSSISQSAVEKHIDYLVKTLPEWISRVSVSSGSYIKINKQTELSQLNSKLKQLLKQKQYQLPSL